MKKTNLLKRAILSLVLLSTIGFSAWSQEEEAAESAFSYDAGVDLYSNYIWRGTKFGTGPAAQPWVSVSIKGLEIGAWGSYNFGVEEAAEADLYVSYGFDFGLSLGVTDYYYPGSDFLEFGDTIGSHAIEFNLGYEIKDFSISANYILNNSIEGAGSIGGDMYFELGYAFGDFGLFAGFGNGWHSVAGSEIKDDGTSEDPWKDDAFGLVNVGFSVSKEVEITDKFSLPIYGAAILNPDSKQFNITVGISF